MPPTSRPDLPGASVELTGSAGLERAVLVPAFCPAIPPAGASVSRCVSVAAGCTCTSPAGCTPVGCTPDPTLSLSSS
eukprot:scaffold4012_cov109-Isochrysis_galbana.AAC.3